MDLDQAAAYLRVTRATLDRWIRQGLVAEAGYRGGRFDPELLAQWARRRGMIIERASASAAARPRDLLADAVERGVVTRGASPATSREAIALAIESLDLEAAARERLLEEVLKRERLAATALGHGVAIPHPRQPLTDLVREPRLSVLCIDPPIDWAAIDGAPVHTALLVLSASMPQHLQLLARISHALRSPGFVDRLRTGPTRDELVEVLRSIAALA